MRAIIARWLAWTSAWISIGFWIHCKGLHICLAAWMTYSLWEPAWRFQKALQTCSIPESPAYLLDCFSSVLPKAGVIVWCPDPSGPWLWKLKHTETGVRLMRAPNKGLLCNQSAHVLQNTADFPVKQDQERIPVCHRSDSPDLLQQKTDKPCNPNQTLHSQDQSEPQKQWDPSGERKKFMNSLVRSIDFWSQLAKDQDKASPRSAYGDWARKEDDVKSPMMEANGSSQAVSSLSLTPSKKEQKESISLIHSPGFQSTLENNKQSRHPEDSCDPLEAQRQAPQQKAHKRQSSNLSDFFGTSRRQSFSPEPLLDKSPGLWDLSSTAQRQRFSPEHLSDALTPEVPKEARSEDRAIGGLLYPLPTPYGHGWCFLSADLQDQWLSFSYSILLALGLFLPLADLFRRLRQIKIAKSMTSQKSQTGYMEALETLPAFRDFVSGLSHELQNPLQCVIHMGRLAKEKVQTLLEKPPAQPSDLWLKQAEKWGAISHDLTLIEQHGQRASQTVEALALHARGEQLPREPLDLSALVRTYAHLAYYSFLASHTGFPHPMPLLQLSPLPLFEASSSEMGRVFFNLITNALQAIWRRFGMQSGGRIRIATRLEPQQIRITITDNGDGIRAAYLQRIFEPLFTTQAPGSGLGVGLSVSRAILARYDATLTCQSQEGKGSTFTLLFPLDTLHPSSVVEGLP